ncbi:putative porin [Saccharicrinis sp. FJH2]|uniref:putative porin n=1 Tax=Saccharicrinis sp. FJH65 TaxID=3344659 RepID=UPI0035F4F31A
MNLRALILVGLFFYCISVLQAQELVKPGSDEQKEGTTYVGPKKLEVKEKESKKAEIFSWKIDPNNLDTFHIAFDTAMNDFFVYYPIYRTSIANAHLGNLGSPYQSMIYFDRPVDLPFLFMDVYRDYMKMPEDYRFYNTKTPYTSLNYWTGGPKLQAEEQVRIIHSRNIHKDINITGYGNYIYGRGFYDRMSTKHLNFSLSTSILKPRYVLYFIGGINNLQNFENGGFADDRYISDPYAVFADRRASRDYATFQVNLNNAQSQLKNRFLYLNHEYRIGYKKDVELEDTIVKEFVAVNTIGHTFKYSEYSKNYVEGSPLPTNGFYQNNFINSATTLDSTYRRVLENKIKLYFEEGLNKYMPFGFGAYIKNELIRQENNSWSFMPDSVFNYGYSQAKSIYSTMVADSSKFEYMRHSNDTTYANTSFGGQIFRRKGKNFFFEAGAEIYFLGYRQGDYSIKGELTKWFAVLDSASLTLNADFSKTTPDYFLNHYASNHFWWNNDFKDVFEQRLEGELKIPSWHAGAKVKLNTIVNYIYYDTASLPRQYTSGLPLVEATLYKDLTVGKFHWDNIATYQITGNSDVLPLPDLAVRSNIYYKNTYANVLRFQIGLDNYYHTSYYVPAYMPATGRFYNQHELLIGNFPMTHAYANFQIKRMRFFIMYYNVLKDVIPPRYFSALHYGYNPRFLKIGVSWNFYD